MTNEKLIATTYGNRTPKAPQGFELTDEFRSPVDDEWYLTAPHMKAFMVSLIPPNGRGGRTRRIILKKL